MRLVVGLGNPGFKYARTRHNIGFRVLDSFAEQNGVKIKQEKQQALTGKIYFKGEKVILAKPQTYMNKSGKAINKLADYYQIKPEEILVVYDDLDLEPGQLRIRPNGGHGGHNGLKSIFATLGTKEFPRLRIGIGKPDKRPVSDYVLDQFSTEEWDLADKALDKASQAVRDYLEGKSLDSLMNEYN